MIETWDTCQRVVREARGRIAAGESPDRVRRALCEAGVHPAVADEVVEAPASGEDVPERRPRRRVLAGATLVATGAMVAAIAVGAPVNPFAAAASTLCAAVGVTALVRGLTP